MPITLNHSNINVQYSTGSNYIIETVKSDLYVRDSRTGISSNLTAEPKVVFPTTITKVQSFTHSGGGETQTSYTFNFPVDTLCDILVIAGGGGGGNSISGGGGAGGMVIVSGVSLSGVYTINVGKGGINGVSAEDGGSDGKNSEIFSGTSYDTATNKIRAFGGGGGGHMFDDGAFDNGNNGGCGGGGKTAVSTTTTISLGGNVTPAVKSGIFSSGVSYGNAGGNGSIQTLPGNNEGGGGGGGCGINKVGGTGLFRANADTSVSLGGKGGDGLYVGDIFGTNIGVSGWVGGGGGGGSFSSLSFGSFQDNTGGQGGGGTGGRDYSGGPQQATAGVDGTGGGGGGGSYVQNGGKGGSGIVIIKYVAFAIPEGNPITHKTWDIAYTVANPTYTLNFPVPTTTDILERTTGRGILNNSNLILHGTYDINFTASSATIVPKTGQYLPFTATSNLSQNIGFRYHLLNPIKMPEGAQWTYNSNNANVYHLGNVGIGTTNPSYNLHVDGTIFTSTGGYTQSALTTWTVMSDRRIKDNIIEASYDKCLENVKNIDLYSFNFKDNCVHTNDKNQLGFIAQEVQQVYPKAVEVSKMTLNTNETIDNVLTLNTTQIDYTLYGAVKELINKVEMLESKIICDVDINV